MARFVISPAAQQDQDIELILANSHERFGQPARLRYEALLARAILDVADDPERIGSQSRPEIAPIARTYHLWHSRTRVEPPGVRVHRPRHFLLFRKCGEGPIEIGRVLHESMDLARHLPEGYRLSKPE